MTTELKRCPFCGSEAELSVDECRPVVCTNEACIASGNAFLLDTDEKVISAWNRRASGWRSCKDDPPEGKNMTGLQMVLEAARNELALINGVIVTDRSEHARRAAFISSPSSYPSSTEPSEDTTWEIKVSDTIELIDAAIERFRRLEEGKAEKLVDMKELMDNAMKLIRRVGDGDADCSAEIAAFPEVLKFVANSCRLGDEYYAR